MSNRNHMEDLTDTAAHPNAPDKNYQSLSGCLLLAGALVGAMIVLVAIVALMSTIGG